jgi:hypothetical protein
MGVMQKNDAVAAALMAPCALYRCNIYIQNCILCTLGVQSADDVINVLMLSGLA